MHIARQRLGKQARKKYAAYNRLGIQTSTPQVGFEPTTPAFERAKTVHAIVRTATVIGKVLYTAVLKRLTY
jgi:hypothetical protein